MDNKFIISTTNLELKPYKLTDTYNLYKLWSNPEVMNLIPEGLSNLEHIEYIMPFIVESFNKCSYEQFSNFGLLVYEKDKDEVIGWCGMINMFPFPELIELFVGFHKEYWGKGYAEEVSAALMNEGFNKFNFETIYAVIVPEHKASAHILQKLGFEYDRIIDNAPNPYEYYNSLIQYRCEKKSFKNFQIANKLT